MHKKSLILLLLLIGLVAVIPAAAQRRRIAKKPVVIAKVQPKPAAVEPTGAIKTPSGLTYLITEKGSGVQPKAGQTVTVHYTGTFTDGRPFDSSRNRGEPISFRLGVGQVIKGWDEGIGKLHVGDKAIFLIPPSIAYGVNGRGSIPPNTPLIFIVELVDVK
jgi:peptidylprolyl isomerase